MKKIPPGAEASNVLVGEVDFLERPITAFVRLAPARLLTGLTEVPVPTRWTPLCSNILLYTSPLSLRGKFCLPALVSVKVTSWPMKSMYLQVFWRMKCSFMCSKPTWISWKMHHKKMKTGLFSDLMNICGRSFGEGRWVSLARQIWTGCIFKSWKEHFEELWTPLTSPLWRRWSGHYAAQSPRKSLFHGPGKEA